MIRIRHAKTNRNQDGKKHAINNKTNNKTNTVDHDLNMKPTYEKSVFIINVNIYNKVIQTHYTTSQVRLIYTNYTNYVNFRISLRISNKNFSIFLI